MSRILLVSSEKSTSAILSKLLKTEGYKVIPAEDPAKAKDLIKTEDYNLLIISAGKGPDTDVAIDVIEASRARSTGIPVVAISENDGGQTAGRLANLKLFDCIEKPLKVDKLIAAVQKAIDQGSATDSGTVLDLQLETCYQFENVVAESPAMKSVCDMISRVAATDVTILLSGENGTGKELLARTIHLNSRRKDKGMVLINCAAADAEKMMFSADGIEKVAGGTLILQEVNALPQSGQQALLKCLQEKKILKTDGSSIPTDMRIVATTSVNLQQMAGEGKFLPDLYKYIRIIFLQLPPLRDRKQDILPIVRQILRNKVGDGKPVPVPDPEAGDLLQNFKWPGNAVQIESVMERSEERRVGKECRSRWSPYH